MNQEVIDGLFKTVEVLVVPFCIWVLKELSALRKDLSEIKTVLIGVDGRNGIRSRTIRLENKVGRIGITLAAHGMTVQDHTQED